MLKDKSDYMIGAVLLMMGISFAIGSSKIQHGKYSELLMGGIILILIGTFLLLNRIVRDCKINKLLRNGTCIVARIKQVDYNYKRTVMEKHPYVVYCSYDDVYTGNHFEFQSDDFWMDSTTAFQIEDEIDVYIEGEKYNKYYVDLKGYLAKKIYM